MIIDRLPSGQIDVTFRTNGRRTPVRSQLVGFAAIAVSIRLDAPADRPIWARVPAPAYRVDGINVATEAGIALDAQQSASRSFLGIVFVVLLFMTVVIYGMWVATGVAAEKSSRVMELMISAASPRQMLTGKVLGIGAAGLTQYVAIAVPALILIAFQDRIAEAVLGPSWAEGAPLVGLTPGLLAGYGVFFLLGFTLFALIYAAMGSFVSRPDDLQTLSLPLSLVAMVGYLTAIVALGGGGGGWVKLASFVPPFSPFVMLARLMVVGGRALGGRAFDRPAPGRDRGRRRRRHPDVCRWRAALWPAPRAAGVRRSGTSGRISLGRPCRARAFCGRARVGGRTGVRRRQAPESSEVRIWSL